MNPTRSQVLVAVLAVTVVVLFGVGAITGTLIPLLPSDGPFSDGNGEQPVTTDERPDDPSTTETIGYVEGYWYDDDLAVDDRDDAALADDELEAVVYRSMARVEVIRNLTFEDEVPVDVVSREEFEADDGTIVGNATTSQQIAQSATYEALFMVDRDTALEDELEELYGGTVEGYYDPATDEVVVVSENPETPELDEVVLGHELLHALQDQHFDLGSYDRETIDQDAATNGLIEGDAVWVDTEYEQRCREEWGCVEPEAEAVAPPTVNQGLYLIVFQPYSDGPAYVDYHLEDGGWAAVDELYEEPPASSAEVIRPGEEPGPRDVAVPDRSSEEWEPFAPGEGGASETVGEVGMVSMFAAGVMDSSRPAVIEADSFLEDGVSYDYDQPPTDGWAGDELVVYAHEDLETTDVRDARDRTAYVWRSEWETADDAEQFLDAYGQLLEGYDAEAVDDHRNTYEIDEAFPGAYAIEQDDETVTIVRAPSVDDLADVEAGVAAGGTDGSEATATATERTDAPAATVADDATDSDRDGDPIGGFGPGSAVVAVLLGSGAGVLLVRARFCRHR